jgi:hypothetical protein
MVDRFWTFAIALALLPGCSDQQRIGEAQSRIAKLEGPSPEFRDVCISRDGSAVCGEVRSIAPSGSLGSFRRFHVGEQIAEVEPYPPFAPRESGRPLTPFDYFQMRDEVCRD